MHNETDRFSAVSFCNDSDYDLLGYMAMKDEDPPSAQTAWEEFYGRHVGYILGALVKAHGEYLEEESLQDLASETMMRVFERAGTFKGSPDTTDREIQCHHVRAWMAVIAGNIYNDQLREQQGLKVIHPENDEWEQISFEVFCNEKPQDNTQGAPEKLKLRWIKEAFENLTERERYVLLVASDYERPDKQHQRLPNKISQELAEALNTTPDGVRQIRKRAKDAIKKHVHQRESERRVYEQNL